MEILLKPGVTRAEREEIYHALHEFFESELPAADGTDSAGRP
jgi:hypothetical protein